MSVQSPLTKSLTDKVKVFRLITINSTPTGQPIEELDAEPDRIIKGRLIERKTILLSVSGQILNSGDRLFTNKKVELNEILEIDDIKYRVVSTRPDRYNRKIFGYESKVDLFRH